jgi:hypothetical protein
MIGILDEWVKKKDAADCSLAPIEASFCSEYHGISFRATLHDPSIPLFHEWIKDSKPRNI